MNDIDTDKMKQEASDTAGQARDKMRENFERARVKAIEARERSRRYIRENPHQSVMMAAGIGALAGMIMAGILGALGRRRRY